MAYDPTSTVYSYPYDIPPQPPAVPPPYVYPTSTVGPAQTVHVYHYDEPPKYPSMTPKSNYQAPPQTLSHTPSRFSTKSSKQPSLKSAQQKPIQSPTFSIYDNHANSVVNDNSDELPTLRAAATQPTKCYQTKMFRIALLLALLALIVIAAVVPLVVLVVTANTSTTTAAPACARTYSATLPTGSSTASDCATWQAFTTGLTCSSYSTMHIYGTNNPTGITINSASVVTGIATALRTNSTYTGVAGGYTWAVGNCGSGLEITSTGSVCSCPNPGYTIRSCIYNNNWGGINGATCGASGQTVSLYFA